MRITTTLRPGAVEGQRVDPVVAADELPVGLVDDHHDVRRHPVEERLELGVADRRSGRVVGRADEHDPGALGDRGRHRVEVVPGRPSVSGTCTETAPQTAAAIG